MLAEVLAAIAPKPGATYVDGTYGAGGYTRGLLEAADCRVVAIDRDPIAIGGGAGLAAEFAGRLILRQGRFSNLDAIAADAGIPKVDGVVLDIGVSSMQLDAADRGFSFQVDGPLDMRMEAVGLTAADIVNTADETLLADILFQLGEERRSRAISRAIVARRAERPYARTLELAETVASVLGSRRIDGRHPATRTFQALRIHVNDELGELAHGLAAAERCLNPGGRLAVVTFHSLEDRIVKRFIGQRAGRVVGASRHVPPAVRSARKASFRLVNSKPFTPSQGEIDLNPRARSARLRVAERADAPEWPLDEAALGVPGLGT
jgi:16S rRNA (cytosine1402-N4)-methyltransferase